jgi:hypothetical protein
MSETIDINWLNSQVNKPPESFNFNYSSVAPEDSNVNDTDKASVDTETTYNNTDDGIHLDDNNKYSINFTNNKSFNLGLLKNNTFECINKKGIFYTKSTRYLNKYIKIILYYLNIFKNMNKDELPENKDELPEKLIAIQKRLPELIKTIAVPELKHVSTEPLIAMIQHIIGYLIGTRKISFVVNDKDECPSYNTITGRTNVNHADTLLYNLIGASLASYYKGNCSYMEHCSIQPQDYNNIFAFIIYLLTENVHVINTINLEFNMKQPISFSNFTYAIKKYIDSKLKPSTSGGKKSRKNKKSKTKKMRRSKSRKYRK